MKSTQRYVTLFTTAGLLLAGSLHAQTNRPAQGNAAQGSSAQRNVDSNLGSIARVAKDTVKNQFTAKDLIGASVHDRTGDKIGDIADIDLQGIAPGALARSFNHQGSAMASSGMSEDATRSSARSIGDSALANATVFVSVGGLWGVGDDLVRVPMSKLSYNTTEKRFELDASKADVVALAEGDARPGYAADTRIGQTSAGKQTFGDEATRVQDALKADPMTSAFAQNVIVTSDGETLELRGTVENKEQQKRIVETARRATALKIDDEIQVRK